VIDRGTNTDAGRTINMHLAVGQQTNPAKRFITQPWTMAFQRGAGQCYVVSAAANLRPLANANRLQLKVRGQNAWDAIRRLSTK
jgi:hypothetical protein